VIGSAVFQAQILAKEKKKKKHTHNTKRKLLYLDQGKIKLRYKNSVLKEAE